MPKFVKKDNLIVGDLFNKKLHADKYPNRDADQARRYPNDPNGARPRGLCPFKVAPNGMVEYAVGDQDFHLLDQVDQDNATDAPTIEDAQ